MKIVSKIIIVIFLNLLIIVSSYAMHFDKFENCLSKKYDFVENGVKLSYMTNNSKEEEKKKILEIINEEYTGAVYVFDNQISFDDVLINLCSNENYVTVEIYKDNQEENINTKSIIENISKKIKQSNLVEYKYFKVKINNIDDVKKEIEEMIGSKFFSISNGYIAEITDNNMQKISIAICKYDTGDFLLMGTPIIYTSF